MDKLLVAVVIEGIVLAFVMFVVTMLYIRYFKRRRRTALALAVAFTFWDIAIIFLFVFRLLEYLVVNGLILNPNNREYGDIGVMLGYSFSALSNIFILIFVSLIFSQAAIFRRTGMLIPIFFAALNGITIGILLGGGIRLWPAPQYTMLPTLYHLTLTFISFIALIAFTRQPLRHAILRWEKAGFRFIILSGVFGILIYLSFALDFLFGDNALGIISGGYTPFFFLAYVFAIFMCGLAYIGFTMPDFVRNRFKETKLDDN
ncbi:MAG: hypothetical protein KGD59_06185 [Candidatus Heimdallarchaeota archaeon]|nr:hypothetical protein [Candidatus Heimdallarchaeota archaeon]MBY8994121.1 hypothetical protein [Candidatus Heimdallarchaeota archaeon]